MQLYPPSSWEGSRRDLEHWIKKRSSQRLYQSCTNPEEGAVHLAVEMITFLAKVYLVSFKGPRSTKEAFRCFEVYLCALISMPASTFSCKPQSHPRRPTVHAKKSDRNQPLCLCRFYLSRRRPTRPPSLPLSPLLGLFPRSPVRLHSFYYACSIRTVSPWGG
jgi:hypothetical protein